MPFFAAARIPRLLFVAMTTFSHFSPLPTAMRIGPHALPNAVFVAPMAGVTDRPFRQLCRRFGAGYAVAEIDRKSVV